MTCSVPRVLRAGISSSEQAKVVLRDSFHSSACKPARPYHLVYPGQCNGMVSQLRSHMALQSHALEPEDSLAQLRRCTQTACSQEAGIGKADAAEIRRKQLRNYRLTA